VQNVLEFWGYNIGEAFFSDKDERKRKLCELMKPFLATESMSNEDSKALFDKIYDGVLDYFEEDDSSDVDNGLQNLALLDAGTNRSYKNAVFPIKRRRILSLDKAGTFVPLCTTNAFLKYYSSSIDKMMYWLPDDRRDYFKSIVDTLTGFFDDEKRGAV
jgi:hypothetical protein